MQTRQGPGPKKEIKILNIDFSTVRTRPLERVRWSAIYVDLLGKSAYIGVARW